MQKWIILCCLILSGCAGTGALYTQKPLSDDKALVHIYRAKNMASSARTASFELDGNKVGELMNNGYLSMYLDPGVHALKQTWNYWLGDVQVMQEPLLITFSSTAGKQKFIRFSNSADFMVVAVRLQWELREVTEEVGSQEIINTHSSATVINAQN